VSQGKPGEQLVKSTANIREKEQEKKMSGKKSN